MNGDDAAGVARLTSALERQVEELRSLRAQLGDPQEAASLLRADDVAARLSKSRAWVYRNQHALGGFRVGGQLRFEPTEIDRYLRSCRSPSSQLPAERRPAQLLPIGGRSQSRGGTNRMPPA